MLCIDMKMISRCPVESPHRFPCRRRSTRIERNLEREEGISLSQEMITLSRYRLLILSLSLSLSREQVMTGRLILTEILDLESFEKF